MKLIELSKAAPLLPLAMFWPSWIWYAERLSDGSDEPWGVLALLAASVIAVKQRVCSELKLVASLPFFILYLLGLSERIPDLMLGVIAVLGCAAAWGLFHSRRFPLVTLLLLSLPLISSLQFFAGYPLRVVVGEIVAHILSAVGFHVNRVGTLLEYQDRLLWIDAPCSGIRSLWCTSFVVVTLCAIFDLKWLHSIKIALLIMPLTMLSNVTRVALLFFTESKLVESPAWFHQGIGLLTFAGTTMLACSIVLRFAATHSRVAARVLLSPRPRYAPYVLFALSSLLPLIVQPVEPVAALSRSTDVTWPQSIDGQALTKLSLTERDKEFQNGFPGKFARFKTQSSEVLIRYVTNATRKLHPAADCLRGIGYQIKPLSAEKTRTNGVKSCVRADKDGKSIKVCEFIVGKEGQEFSDPSTWFWHAFFNPKAGPWYAFTVSEEM